MVDNARLQHDLASAHSRPRLDANAVTDSQGERWGRPEAFKLAHNARMMRLVVEGW
jgi:hypothetical protein